MKKIILISAIALVLTGLYLFRDPIIDFLPIDQSGWSTNEHGICYLDENGDAVSGWHTIDGIPHYFTPETCTPHTGWVEKDGLRCYVADGAPVTGWLELENSRYYLNSDGTVFTGWLEKNGQRMYLDKNGTPSSGWTDTAEGRFYFDDSGVLCTGLVRIGETLYCFDQDGAAHTGWFEQDSQRYFANEDGSVHIGWLEDDGKRYYLKEDGTAAVGRLVIDGETYFFSSTGMNFIMVNPWNDLPEDFEPELVLFEDNWISAECEKDLEQMMADCRAAGHSPRILSGYRSIEDQMITLNNAVKVRMASGYSYDEAYRRATQAVAVPGTSEHHLGQALDIVDSQYPKLNEYQENMPTQKWLMENSWKYGFIMRYPNGDTEITGIIYEPWHYRYVGREMAAEIHEMGVCLEVYVDMLTNDGTTCGGKLATE